MKKIGVLIAVTWMSGPCAASAQQPPIHVSNAKPTVGEEVTIRLDPPPGRNESITWTIQSGEGRFDGDATQPRVLFRATKAGDVIIVCVINAPGQLQRRPSTTLTVTGPVPVAGPPPAAQPDVPVRPPAPMAPGKSAGTLTLEDIDFIVPSGWMGDAMSENNGTALLDSGHTNGCRSGPSCHRVEYKPGKVGWAAFAWQRVPEGSMNWGEYPGADLSPQGYGRGREFQSLRIWARGDLSASGGTPPKAQFKSGGNVAPNFSKNNPASYTVAGPTVEVNDWTEYCLDLRDKNLSNVVSPLTVVVTKAANPKNAVIVIDDVVFSTSACPR